MKSPLVRSVPFDPAHHSAVGFDCGNAALNTWLTLHAHRARQMGTAHTFVLADASTVLAYYSLTATSVSAADAPRSLAHGSPQTIPAWLIARLAVDRHVQGRGIGVATLIDAFGRLTIASLNGPAARLVVVDAIDHGAHKFYEKNGFRSVPESNRLFMKMSTTRQIATQG